MDSNTVIEQNYWIRTVLLAKRNILLDVENDGFEHGLLSKIFEHTQFYLQQEIILTGVESLVVEQNTLILTGVENWIIEQNYEFARCYWREIFCLVSKTIGSNTAYWTKSFCPHSFTCDKKLLQLYKMLVNFWIKRNFLW